MEAERTVDLRDANPRKLGTFLTDDTLNAPHDSPAGKNFDSVAAEPPCDADIRNLP